MIDFDDLDDAEDHGDEDQKARVAAANKDWEDRKAEEKRKEEEAERKRQEAIAAARARREREEEERHRKEEERRRRQEEELAKRQEDQRAAAQQTGDNSREQAKLPGAPLALGGGPAEPRKDLALGRPAKASSTKQAERGPQCAVDGNPQSRWTSAYADNQWLAIDLGSRCKISQVEVRWEAAYADTYLIQGSTDEVDWSILGTQTGNEGWVVSTLPADSSAVRWVRIFGQKRATGFGFSIWEVKVFGSETGEGGGVNLPGKPALLEDQQYARDDYGGAQDAPLGRRDDQTSLERDDAAQAILDAVGRPYEVLGLLPGARSADIRRAYHLLALKYHPDKAGDEEVFRAICSAYKALTEARDNDTETGWRDMEGQAVGPWAGHEEGVNVVLFDTFGSPPWESRRLYTGCWSEAVVRCWELSKGEPGKVRPPPRLLGQIEVGGFINDLAAISPHGLLTAQSAGMIPQPGESLRVFDVNRTPFLRPPRGTAEAIEDGTGSGTLALDGAQAGSSGGQLALQKQERDEECERRERENADKEDSSQKVFLHQRGCRALSLWPRPDHRDAAPVLVASVSKDNLGVSRIAEGGNNIEILWKRPDPHGTDVNALCWDSWGKVWSGGNDGICRLWDVASGRQEPVLKMAGGSGHVNKMEVWPQAGILVSAHTSGVSYLDARVGDVIHLHSTSKSVKALASLRPGHASFFVGFGNDMNQYDTRAFHAGVEKPKAVGQWTLRGEVLSLNCTSSARGHLLVAVGCKDGKVAAFDTT